MSEGVYFLLVCTPGRRLLGDVAHLSVRALDGGRVQWSELRPGQVLNALRDACHANAKAHGFHDRPQPVSEAIALMHSELSEALEDHREGHAPDEVWYTGKGTPFEKMWSNTDEHPTFDGHLLKPCGIPSEIADVIIRALDFCGLHGIDIGRAVAEKMAYNAERPHMHGTKKF